MYVCRLDAPTRSPLTRSLQPEWKRSSCWISEMLRTGTVHAWYIKLRCYSGLILYTAHSPIHLYTWIYRAVVDTTIEATHPDPRQPAPRRRPVYQWTASLTQQSQANPPKINAPQSESTRAVSNNQTYKAQGKGHNSDHPSSSFSSSASAAGGWFSKTISSKLAIHIHINLCITLMRVCISSVWCHRLFILFLILSCTYAWICLAGLTQLQSTLAPPLRPPAQSPNKAGGVQATWVKTPIIVQVWRCTHILHSSYAHMYTTCNVISDGYTMCRFPATTALRSSPSKGLILTRVTQIDLISRPSHLPLLQLVLPHPPHC